MKNILYFIVAMIISPIFMAIAGVGMCGDSMNWNAFFGPVSAMVLGFIFGRLSNDVERDTNHD